MNQLQEERMQLILEACKTPKDINELFASTKLTRNEVYPLLAVMLESGCLDIAGKKKATYRKYRTVPGAALPKKLARHAEVSPLWTKEHDELLRQNYPTMDIYQLMALLGRSKKAIWGRARILGLSKNKPQPQIISPKNRFSGVQGNVGWLISYPTTKPKGARLITFDENQHTVGSPRKLSPWTGYSCEVMA